MSAGRKRYLIGTAAGLAGGLAVSWYVEPGTAAGSALLTGFGVLAGLALAWFAGAFIPVESDTCCWTGISGRSYEYEICSAYFKFAEHQVVPGNFAFVRTADGVTCPLFFGQTDDAVERRPQRHVAWDEAVRLGVTHVHWRSNKDERARLSEVDDLVVKYAPPLNAKVRLVGRTSRLTDFTIGGRNTGEGT